MPESSRKFLIGVTLWLGAGTLIGWLYGRPLLGLAVAALGALVWQVRRLLAFDQALKTGDFAAFRHGEGIWQKFYSRLSYEHDRAERYKREYRLLLKEIRKSTNAMPDGAVILDNANEIVVCNRAAKNLAGLKRKKDRGQRVDNILRHPELTKLLHSDDATRTVDIESPMIEGAWLNCRVVPYGADQKMLLLRDVTESMVLSRMRRDFVANASHELRSPLTVISGYLDSLVDDEQVPQYLSQPLEQMQAQAKRMTAIVNELLELSRLEGAGRAGTEEIVDVLSLIGMARKAYADRADIPPIAVEAESSAQLYGNGAEIESLVENLLSNAVRHTPPEGRVVISWRSGSDGADLLVSDTGEGIAAEHIPRLTERFFRVDHGRAREDGGVGLGLAIVKHILSRHDAELHISSKMGAGSDFRCRFPRQRVVVDPPVPIVSGGQSA